MEGDNNNHGGSVDEFDDSDVIGDAIDAAVVGGNGIKPNGARTDDEQMFYTEATIGEIIQTKLSKRVRDLQTFFRANHFATEKGDQNTNIINVAEKKTYNIPDVHVEEFFGILDDCRKEKRMIHYSERQETASKSKSGIMIDFDRYQRSKDAQLTDRHFEALTRHIAKLLNEFLDFSQAADGGKFTFHVFVIRKPGIVFAPVKNAAPNAPPVYKDGFHLLIPEIQVLKGLKRYLLDELLSRGIIKRVFNDIDHIEPADKMLDKMSASNPVHFIGCSKPEKPAYLLSHAYKVTIYIDDDDIDRKLLNVAELTSGIYRETAETKPLDINLTYELSLGFYFPQLGGKNTWLKKRQFDYRMELQGKIQLMLEKTNKNILAQDEIEAADNSVDILTMGNAEAAYLKKVLEILDLSYASEYEKWYKVICAIAHTNTNYKALAIWFSHRKPESWSPLEIERVWNEATNGRFARKPVTKRSLIHWARESSPQRFADINKENYFNVLARYAYDNEGRVEHSMAAKVLYAMVGDKFVCDTGESEKAGKKSYCWYEFVLPGQAMKKGEVYKWRKELEPDNIHLFISEHLPKVYEQLAANIKGRKDNADNEVEGKYWAGVEKTFKRYQSALSNDTFQNGVVRQSQYRFRSRGFTDELDKYEDVLGVGNGVLKIGADAQLIKGFHEYKISKYTEIDYSPDMDTPYVRTLLKAFRDIFPEEDVFNFMMFHAATGLDAKESACILVLLVGGGQNGKSFFAKMVHNTLGQEYCGSGKMALLTAPMERAESANSAQMQMKDKRWFYFDEANKCEVLNPARVKSVVNPGYQSGRDLNQRQQNFKNTCNPIAMSNYDFAIETTDHGMWRRIYYYKNKVKFCANPNPNNPYEKKEDRRFMYEYTNNPLYLQAMLTILVHYYQRLCREFGGDIKNVPVPTILHETEEFRNRQDAVNRFITQMVVKSPKVETTLNTVAGKYVEWYNKNIKNANQPITDVMSQFENSRIATHLVRRPGGVQYLVGFRIKTAVDEKIDEDAGEEMLVSAPSPSLSFDVNIPSSAVNIERETKDEFMKDLTLNAPIHLPTYDNIADVSNEEINDILKTL